MLHYKHSVSGLKRTDEQFLAACFIPEVQSVDKATLAHTQPQRKAGIVRDGIPIGNLCVDSIDCVKGKTVPCAVLTVTAESVCQIMLHAGGIQRVDRGVAVIRLFPRKLYPRKHILAGKTFSRRKIKIIDIMMRFTVRLDCRHFQTQKAPVPVTLPANGVFDAI